MTARGLTLLEVLVALALLGALAGTAVPAVEPLLDRWRLAAATRQVVMDLKLARARAVAAGAAHRLRFLVPSATYQLERQHPGGGYTPAAAPIALPDGVRVVDCTAAGDAVAFRPRGHAVAFGAVVLENDRGLRRRVVVDIAGRLRVQQ